MARHAAKALALVAMILGVAMLGVAAADKMCDECWGKSSGPCRHDADWSCLDYISGTKTCPAGTSECGPIDCQVSAWSAWSKCDAECDGGSQSRSRKVTVPASHGGAKCPVLSEWRSCNTHKCEKDKCIVSDWSDWSKCSAACGGGKSTRTRKVVSGWKSCPDLSETTDCNTFSCDSCASCAGKTSGPCKHDAKGDDTCFNFFPGTSQCPPGTTACKVYKKDIGTLGGKPGNGMCTGCFGKSAGPCRHDKAPVCHDFLPGTKTCPAGTSMCKPIDCEVSEWSKWTKCDANCGGGVTRRFRSITVKPTDGGASCPHLEESDKCNTHKCYPKCDKCTGKSSGPCQHDKDNTCYDYMKGSKDVCPPGTHECKEVDCVVSQWSDWGKCSAKCGGGVMFRTRVVKVSPTKGGKQCPHLTEDEECNEHKCAHCVGCAGKSEGPCQSAKGVCYDYYKGTSTCPAGTSDCKDDKKTWEEHEGKPGDGLCAHCFGKSTGPCRHDKDNSCHAFTPGTKSCPIGTTACKPINCEVSEWAAWSKCSKSCGGGSQSRARKITVWPQNGGAKCPHLSEDQSCNKHKCIPKCNKCTLGTHGPCQHDKDNTCFGYFPKDGLMVCPPGSHECVVQDCVVSEWTAWGKCSATCNGGSQSRSRKVLKSPSPGGIQCPHLSEDQSCNKHKCPHCTGCAGKTSGPCQSEKGFACFDYYENTNTCPAGTVECSKKGNTFSALGDKAGDAGDGLCTDCFGKSAGPCRHLKDTSCYWYTAGTKTCPPGTAPCKPINCEVSEWSAWSKCSKSCGGGSSSRSRKVTVQPTNGGTQCPHLSESNTCNTHKCPVACTECNGKSAGPCRHDKDGTCHNFLKDTGACPPGTTICKEIDCEVSDWSAWSKCSKNCGGGSQGRSRKIVTHPTPNGQQCPHLSEDQKCNTHKCASCAGCAGKSEGPCMHINDNSCHDYHAGTKTCPAGTIECSSAKKDFATLGGKPGNGMCTGCFGKSAGPCRHLKDTSCYGYMYGTKTCPPGTAPCAPVNCEVSAWSGWSKCTKNCGGGSQSRSRKVTVQPSNGGAECPHLSEDQKCNTHKCPPACTACWDKTSGPCRHDKDMTCHEFLKDTGACPPGTTLCQDTDCVVSQWGAWTKCSAKCGGGIQGRSRKVVTAPTGNGKACPELSESQDCNTHKCESCSGCVGGTSGPCQHDKSHVCNGYYEGTKLCPAGTTACSVKKTDLGTLAVAPGNGLCSDCFGKSAGPCRHLKDTSCYGYIAGTTTCPPGTAPCNPINCEVSEWSGWSKCSKSCGGGLQGRTRKVTIEPSNGGAACPHLSEEQKCNDFKCPVQCNACAGKSSGPCQSDKDDTCYNYYTKGGVSGCPAGTHECVPVDCVVSEWGAWGKCSVKCGGGSQSRSRSIKVHPKNGGFECPHLSEDQACNKHKCEGCHSCAGKSEGPCQHDNDYSCFSYIAGTKSCPAGTHECKKTATTFEVQGGKPGSGSCDGCFGKSDGPCQHDKDNTCFGWLVGNQGVCPPGTHNCKPVSCEVSEWTAWSKCTAKCGGGSQGRSRSIKVFPKNGGAECPHLSEDQSCNKQACKPVCTACAGKSSGPCQHDKDDTCHGLKGGVCPPGTHHCAKPVDCVVSEWTKWSLCSAKCGGGKTTRSRSIKVPAANGGKECPHLSETDSCNKHDCKSCSACAGKSNGPCQNPANSVCYGYYKGTKTCPAGTVSCLVTKKTIDDVTVLGSKIGDGFCKGCLDKTEGPCHHLNDGSCFGYMAGTQTCPPGTAPCKPIDCQVSKWSAWSKCSAVCGGGSQSRTRKVTVAPENGGAECPHLSEKQDCNTHICPIQCTDCAKDTAGPCQSGKPGTDCVAWAKGTKSCPKGYTQCVPVDCEVTEWGAWSKCTANCGGGLTNRVRKVKVPAANGGAECPHLSETESCNKEPCKDCAGCLAKTAGPCQNLANSVCYGYYKGTEICPAGTVSCKDTKKTLGIQGGKVGSGLCDKCVGSSSGPCQSDKGVCYGFYKGTTQCPAGTSACKPNNCEVTTWTAWSACSAKCGGGVRSRSRKVTKFPNNGGASCPELYSEESCNVHKCGVPKKDSGKCGSCGGKSAGPCRHVKDNSCFDYYTGTSICPAGTTACVLCDKCSGKTAGPCQHDKDGSCHQYLTGTSCPPGTHECGKWDGVVDPKDPKKPVTPPVKNDVCTGCWPGTAGPCQQKNTVCHDYFPGTKTCPGGTHECKKVGSAKPKDFVVFDVHFDDDEVNADELAAEIAAATGRDEDYVVVESDTASADGGRDIGFVVVVKDDEDASATVGAVSGALESSQAGAGFAGMNKPAEMSVGSQAVTAPASGSGLSSLAVALIATGGAAALALIVAGIVLARRGKDGLTRKSSSKVMAIHIPSQSSMKVRANPHDEEHDSDDE